MTAEEKNESLRYMLDVSLQIFKEIIESRVVDVNARKIPSKLTKTIESRLIAFKDALAKMDSHDPYSPN